MKELETVNEEGRLRDNPNHFGTPPVIPRRAPERRRELDERGVPLTQPRVDFPRFPHSRSLTLYARRSMSLKVVCLRCFFLPWEPKNSERIHFPLYTSSQVRYYFFPFADRAVQVSTRSPILELHTHQWTKIFAQSSNVSSPSETSEFIFYPILKDKL